jgi:hypothetical protein
MLVICSTLKVSGDVSHQYKRDKKCCYFTNRGLQIWKVNEIADISESLMLQSNVTYCCETREKMSNKIVREASI